MYKTVIDIFCLVLIFSGFQADLYAQQYVKEYLDKDHNITEKDKAVYYRVSTKDAKGRKTGKAETYYMDGGKHSVGYYDKGRKDSVFAYYYRSGQPKKKIRYQTGKPADTLKKWYEHGQIRETGYFDPDTALKGFYRYAKKHYRIISYYDSSGKQVVSKGTGPYTAYYDNGQLKEKGRYEQGLKTGEWIRYDTSGHIDYKETYRQGNLQHGKNYTAKGDSVSYTVAEQEPGFNGGDTALMYYVAKRVHYPLMARYKQVEGKVRVQFLVDKKGKVRNPRVVQGIGSGCDEEALRVIKHLPRWESAKTRGIPVAVNMIIPVNFSLHE